MKNFKALLYSLLFVILINTNLYSISLNSTSLASCSVDTVLYLDDLKSYKKIISKPKLLVKKLTTKGLKIA